MVMGDDATFQRGVSSYVARMLGAFQVLYRPLDNVDSKWPSMSRVINFDFVIQHRD